MLAAKSVELLANQLARLLVLLETNNAKIKQDKGAYAPLDFWRKNA